MKAAATTSGAAAVAPGPMAATVPSSVEGEQKKSNINAELWQACAGPLVNLPAAGTHVVYFPQGHSEQVAASMKKDVDAQIPNYPNLPSKLLCLLHSLTLHADPETDEVYAQMTLQPVSSFDKEALIRSDFSLKTHKPQTEFFCKTLTASDTSTHGGFSVPRRAAEKIFPPLDYSMQPPAQELVARDLHENVWTFRHIYRAAAHAAANNSPFTVFFNPRASPSEFVIPFAKFYKALFGQQVSLGMRFRMQFETEESGTRRYMGTITSISDLDPVRWKNSQWRNLQVGWDESTAGEKRNRVSVWEIEPVTAPFFICPPPFFRPKRPRQPGMPDDDMSDLYSPFKRAVPWLGEDNFMKDPQALGGLSLAQWMNMQQNPSLGNSMQANFLPSLSTSLQNVPGTDLSRQLGFAASQINQQNGLQFNSQMPSQSVQQLDQLLNSSATLNPLETMLQSQNQLSDVSLQVRQNLINQSLCSSQVQSQILQPPNLVQTLNAVQVQQPSLQTYQLQRSLSQMLPQQQQQQILSQIPQSNMAPLQIPDQLNQQGQVSDPQAQLQLWQKLQQQSLSSPQSMFMQSATLAQIQEEQKPHFDRSQSFSGPMAPQVLETSQAQFTSLSQSQLIAQHLTRTNSHTNNQFSQLSQLSKVQQQQSGFIPEVKGQFGATTNPATSQLPVAGSSNSTLAAMGAQSAITDEPPSCSTSPSTNNFSKAVQTVMNSRRNRSHTSEGMLHSSATATCSDGFETINANMVIELPQKCDMNVSVNISKNQNHEPLTQQAHQNVHSTQIDCLDSSSATSVSHSRHDGHLSQNNNPLSFNSQPFFSREMGHGGELQTDSRNMAHMESHLEASPVSEALFTRSMLDPGKDFFNNISSGDLLGNYDNPKDAQQELSSSMVTQQFGVPDVIFNSIDSTMSDSSLLNRSSWAPPQYQRMRTYTKVYKRGAVGRSIDVTRYSGYEELKQDLARRFGIEGQMEDRGRVGWMLVYVDHESDVLLLGDDPWEEFVRCVRCIKILSPQEVQQISLNGDLGSPSVPHQACSSSDNGNL
ncbi:hypothetical protein Drorol1_Dr00017047 [Drosera rotundifolia]